MAGYDSEINWVTWKMGMRTGFTTGNVIGFDPYDNSYVVAGRTPDFPHQLPNGMFNNQGPALGCDSCVPDVVTTRPAAAAKGRESRVFSTSGKQCRYSHSIA